MTVENSIKSSLKIVPLPHEFYLIVPGYGFRFTFILSIE